MDATWIILFIFRIRVDAVFTMGLCGSVVYFLNPGGSVFTMGLCGDLLFIFRTRVDAVFTMGMCVYGILWFRSTTFYSSSHKKAPRKKISQPPLDRR